MKIKQQICLFNSIQLKAEALEEARKKKEKEEQEAKAQVRFIVTFFLL